MPSRPQTQSCEGRPPPPPRAHPAQTQPPADSPALASCQALAYLPLHSLSAIVSNQFRKQLLEQLENITRKNYIIIVRLDLRHLKKKKAELSPNRDPREEKDGVPGEQGGARARTLGGGEQRCPSAGRARPSRLSRPKSQRQGLGGRQPSSCTVDRPAEQVDQTATCPSEEGGAGETVQLKFRRSTDTDRKRACPKPHRTRGSKPAAHALSPCKLLSTSL